MNKQENKLQEQEAPLKNTDKAFVQVSEDGSPLIPDEKDNNEVKPDKSTDLDKR